MHESKTSQRVYILSSKHTYRPMRARVVAQLFYKCRSLLALYIQASFLTGKTSRPTHQKFQIPAQLIDCLEEGSSSSKPEIKRNKNLSVVLTLTRGRILQLWVSVNVKILGFAFIL